MHLAPNYDFDLIPQQSAFHQSKARFKVCVAGVRSGKTLAGVVDLIKQGYERLQSGNVNPLYNASTKSRHKIPAIHLWIVSPTMDMAKIPLRYFIDVAGDLIDHKRSSEHEKSFWLWGDILVEFKSTDRPDGLQGASLDGFLKDESASTRSGEAWHDSLRPRLTDRKGFAIFATTPHGFNWFYRDIYVPAKNKENGFELFQWHTEDNPLIDREEIEAAKAMYANMPQTYRTLYQASFEAFEGQIYDCFDYDQHTLQDAEFRSAFNIISDKAVRLACTSIWAGIDFGHSNPGCVVVFGRLANRDNEYIVLDEAYFSGVSVLSLTPHAQSWLSICKHFQSLYGIKQFYGDSADPGAIKDLLQNGINIVPAKKGPGSVLDGIETVKMLLASNKIKILTKCTNLLQEFPQYQWRKQKNVGDIEEPSRATPNHALDALRYVCSAVVPKTILPQSFHSITYPIRKVY